MLDQAHSLSTGILWERLQDNREVVIPTSPLSGDESELRYSMAVNAKERRSADTSKFEPMLIYTV